LYSVVEGTSGKKPRCVTTSRTPIFFAKGKQVLGIIAVADKIKTDSAKAIEELKRMGIRTVMLTGDNKLSAETIAKQVGIEEVFAELKPEQKEKAIQDYSLVSLVKYSYAFIALTVLT
jgi:P-type E1-E2 ATPase